ncbi:MAG: M23 family metallopeptidase, partial [Prevotellaceae bacterium]|nr:M23 family metallopeptidase [Prevotellaceae bacterium]
MRLQIILLLLAFNIGMHVTYAQNKFANPIDGTLLLSANYGELRSMHFHSGIDLKVGGVPGAKVYAVDDAFVYRLSVSPYGYGNCVYLKHSDGTVTVYGHLHKFSPVIADFIKTEQYRRNSFAIDTTFTEPVFTVKKRDLIGFAGNSGNSFGAHLHFEIRNRQNVQINPIPKFYSVKDNIPPVIKSLTVFTVDSFMNVGFKRITHDIKLNIKGKHNIAKTIEIESPAFFGIETFDNVNETYNKTGIRKMYVSFDNAVIFSFSLDSAGFEKNHYINSLQAYDLLINENRNVIKTCVEKGNSMNIYKNVVNNGIIEINDSLTHRVSITLEDDYENKSVLNFNVKARKKSQNNQFANYKKSNCIEWKYGGSIICESAGLIIHPETFYDNTYVEMQKSDTVINDFSNVYFVNFNSSPVQKSCTVIVKTNLADSLRNKVMLGAFYNGKSFAVNAKYFMGFITAKISSTANYFVTVDTISPHITPKFRDG